jgi:hypothetical protein
VWDDKAKGNELLLGRGQGLEVLKGVEVDVRGNRCWDLSVHISLKAQPLQEQEGGQGAGAVQGVGDEVVSL